MALANNTDVERKKARIKPFYYCVMGGTFDRLHEGHKLLLRTASALAEKVFVGVVSDEFEDKLRRKKKFGSLIQPYEVRLRNLREFVKTLDASFLLGSLTDPYGPAITEATADVIVVSRETEKTAMKINEIRIKRSLPPLQICIVPFIKLENGQILSSTLLREMEEKQRQNSSDKET